MGTGKRIKENKHNPGVIMEKREIESKDTISLFLCGIYIV